MGLATCLAHTALSSLFIFFLFGLGPHAALGLSVGNVLIIALRKWPHARLVGTVIGSLPTLPALLLLQATVLGGVAWCGYMYHDMLCQQFLLTRELQLSKDARIDQLAAEKERLGYDYAFAVRRLPRTNVSAGAGGDAALPRRPAAPGDDEIVAGVPPTALALDSQTLLHGGACGPEAAVPRVASPGAPPAVALPDLLPRLSDDGLVDSESSSAFWEAARKHKERDALNAPSGLGGTGTRSYDSQPGSQTPARMRRSLA